MRLVPGDAKLDGTALIAGFHGIGATGYWTVKFLVNELKAKRVCFIDYEHAPAVSFFSEKRVITPYEVYAARDLSLLKAEISPVRERENEFYGGLAEWLRESGVREVALVGGLDESLRNDDSKYKVVMTSKFAERGELKDERFLEDDRMIVGPVAALLNYFEMYSFPAYAVLAYSNVERVDPRAAACAVGFLSRRYGFEADVAPLIKGAEAIEGEVKMVEERERGPSSSVYS
ncbi:MAG: proteasome assembly chaperone family protein [Nitrososphaerota archaeon]|nr:proteasome assembly chaperone family protein [Nitrososphaerota archaeon]